jgi:peptide/nickel transport system ATP-binding protein/oligopeptide transport system ATP-binding protein
MTAGVINPLAVDPTSGESGTVLTVEALKVHFPTRFRRERLRAVDGVDFSVRQGETFGIIGESGSGKSTLGRAVTGLTRPTSGRVLHGGKDIHLLSPRELRSHRRDVQMIFQDSHAAFDPRMTILQSVREPLDIAGDGAGAERDRIALEMLARVGLSAPTASRYPHQISGGQKQRANIARAIVLRPTLLVCDEVVAALDVSIQAEVLNLFAGLQRDFGLTYLFITHDLSVVSHISDRIAVMYLGVLMEMGPADAVCAGPRHPYTEALLSAELQPTASAGRASSRIILEGEIPSPIAPPAGCRFHTRCRYAEPVCAIENPAWREVEPDHWSACHFAATLRLRGRNDRRQSQKGGTDEQCFPP